MKISIGLVKASVIAGVVFIVALNAIVFLWDTGRQILLSFDNSQIFSIFDDKITFVIDNDQSNSAKDLNVYGIGNITSVTISSSKMVANQRGLPMEIKFDGNASIKIENISIVPEKTKVSISPIETGLYQGALFVANSDKTTIPLTIAIKPQITQPLMIVVDGIVVTIAFWKLIKFLNERNNPIILKGLIIAQSPEQPRSFTQYFEDKNASNTIILKNGILDIGTIIFGIAVGLTALFNGTILTGIYTLGSLETITLFGIGLGIGSLKEFITRS